MYPYDKQLSTDKIRMRAGYRSTFSAYFYSYIFVAMAAEKLTSDKKKLAPIISIF